MIKELFEAASSRPPPLGLGRSPQVCSLFINPFVTRIPMRKFVVC